jgi:hemerythrin-like domain-containing protein
MQARGPLMIEHRLIERMIAAIDAELGHIRRSGKTDPLLIDTTVDFIRVYADHTHHGKEEKIFFRDLAKKPLSEAERRVLDELIEEHVFGRKITGELVEANNRYRKGDRGSLQLIATRLQTLVTFYPQHIKKEDKVFFPAATQHLSDKEQQTMLEAFWEFDRKMIHEKYRMVVESLGA